MRIQKEELQELQKYIDRRISELQLSPNKNASDLFDLNMLDSNLSLFLLNAEFHDGPLELGPRDKMILEALKEFRDSKNQNSDYSTMVFIEEIAIQAGELLENIKAVQSQIATFPGKTLVENLNARFDNAYESVAQVSRLLVAGKKEQKKWADEEIPMPTTNAGKVLGKIKSEKKANASRENGKKGGRPRKNPANAE